MPPISSQLTPPPDEPVPVLPAGERTRSLRRARRRGLARPRLVASVTRSGITQVGEIVDLGPEGVLMAGLGTVIPGFHYELRFRPRPGEAAVSVQVRAAVTGPRARGLDLVALEPIDPPPELIPALRPPPSADASPVPFDAGVELPAPVARKWEVWTHLGEDEVFDRYEGYDRDSGDPVTIRILREPRASDVAFLDAFHRLHRDAVGLEHPHVVGVRACLEDRGRHVVVGEPPGGPTLATRFEVRAPMDVEESVRVVRQLLDGLRRIHASGLPFGTVHPGRVHLGRDGQARLADLVVAQIAPLASVEAGDQPLVYAAPEVRAGRRPDARSETWSMGMLLYAMVAGGSPYFAGEARRLRTDPDLPPPRPGARIADLPVPIARLIERALAHERADRFPSPGAFARTLDQALVQARGGPRRRRRVLVVDDDRSVRAILVEILQSAGYEVLQATNGIEGLEVAFAEDPLDLVCLDMRMPGLDGCEVCTLLRGDERLAEVPVLAITGEPRHEVYPVFLAAGANGFLEKPFGTRSLLEQVHELLR